MLFWRGCWPDGQRNESEGERDKGWDVVWQKEACGSPISTRTTPFITSSNCAERAAFTIYCSVLFTGAERRNKYVLSKHTHTGLERRGEKHYQCFKIREGAERDKSNCVLAFNKTKTHPG